PQAIGMVAVEPEEGAAQEKAPHFRPAVVEDQAPPIWVISLLRRSVLVEVRAVEIAEAMLVAGEVGRHPVEDDADSLLMQVVDKEHEVLRRAIARGRTEVPGCLV